MRHKTSTTLISVIAGITSVLAALVPVVADILPKLLDQAKSVNTSQLLAVSTVLFSGVFIIIALLILLNKEKQ